MPFISKKRGMKRGSKKGMARRRIFPKRTGTVLVNTSTTPIPSKFITKHKYATTFVLQASNNYAYVMNLNSLFDPDRSGGGHQPYGRDQLAALYNRYRVFGATYSLSFYNSSTTAKVAVIPSNEIITLTNVSEAMENPMAKWAIQVPGGSQKVIKGYVNLPKLVGATKTQYITDDRYSAQKDSDPQELLALNVFGANIADTGVDIQVSIVIQYHCEWYDRFSLDQS